MSSEDLRKSQQDVFSVVQQLRSLTPSPAQSLALQSMAAQIENDGTNRGTSLVTSEQYLVFSLADRELAVKAEFVQGVERLVDLTPVPNVVPWVRGVMNLRGSIISVVDLRMFLDLDLLPYSPHTRLLSLQYNEMVICFVVDGVSEMLPIPPTTIVNGNVRQATIPQWVLPYTAGCALFTHRMVVILDVPRLLFSEKIQQYKAFS
ncbi:MAG: chemotaxis protein CheW [Ktedonobacteraceae bacterium]|nr:chemotaxis protein CheW [Ktedonobacteraceae bacterium]MBV9615098.1 chemotaxis protein CheW [Ktedonobacteraceae bacterium]MBV9713656.1 chemotaxis protein CheW [Ktedonobacteraceae bacterium]